jgi:hypothetical protein
MSYFRRLLSAELWHFLVGRGGVGRRPRSSCHQWRSRFFVVSLAFSQPEARHRRTSSRRAFTLNSAVELTAKNAKIAKKDSYELIA